VNPHNLHNRVRQYREELERNSINSLMVFDAAYDQFEAFYANQGSVFQFFKNIVEDRSLDIDSRKDVAINTIKGFVTYLEQQNKSEKTVLTYVGAIQSLGRRLDVPFTTRFADLPSGKVQTKKHSWDPDGVKKFLDSFESPLHKALGAAFFQSGSDISTFTAIEYQDIAEQYEAGIFPICLDLIRHKTDVPHVTFLGEWSCNYLRIWIESIGNLKPETKIFLIPGNEKPISKQAVDSYFFRRGLEFSGKAEKKEKFEYRNPYAPHTLRAGFNTNLRDHKADPIYVEYWMGHKIRDEQKAYVAKSNDAWRKTYIHMAEPWVTPPAERRKELRDIAEAWAKAQGISP
jgi:hypothetical protein